MDGLPRQICVIPHAVPQDGQGRRDHRLRSRPESVEELFGRCRNVRRKRRFGPIFRTVHEALFQPLEKRQNKPGKVESAPVQSGRIDGPSAHISHQRSQSPVDGQLTQHHLTVFRNLSPPFRIRLIFNLKKARQIQKFVNFKIKGAKFKNSKSAPNSKNSKKKRQIQII